MSDTISREQARAQGLKHYFTGKPCKNGHVEKRLLVGTCLACARERKRVARGAPKDQGRRPGMSSEQRKEANRRNSRAWAARNKDKAQEAKARWLARNPEARRRAVTAWEKRNKDYLRRKAAARRAAILQATPGWLTTDDLSEIARVYAEAVRLEQETGVKHHVDHVVPLRGRGVCGLHAPWNLRAIPAAENRRKHNKLETE